jgi:hypothetical protein
MNNTNNFKQSFDALKNIKAKYSKFKYLKKKNLNKYNKFRTIDKSNLLNFKNTFSNLNKNPKALSSSNLKTHLYSKSN